MVQLGFAKFATGCDAEGEGPPQVWRDTFVLMERTAALPAASEEPAEKRAAAHAFAALRFIVLEVQHDENSAWTWVRQNADAIRAEDGPKIQIICGEVRSAACAHAAAPAALITCRFRLSQGRLVSAD